jgi:preprotein translocase subunit SecF
MLSHFILALIICLAAGCLSATLMTPEEWAQWEKEQEFERQDKEWRDSVR